jgi:hypothetical protein
MRRRILIGLAALAVEFAILITLAVLLGAIEAAILVGSGETELRGQVEEANRALHPLILIVSIAITHRLFRPWRPKPAGPWRIAERAGSKELCECGHQRSDHLDTVGFGHGRCGVCRQCVNFTWTGVVYTS